METPIFDFVQRYAREGVSRLHMPGHKGAALLGCEAADITEIKGADALYEADGIIARSEENAAALFGTGMSCYSTEGSSHAIRTMVYLAWLGRAPGRARILAARNVHKSFIYACALVGCEADWLYPQAQGDNSICSCQIAPEAVARALARAETLPFAVYVTSPDYLGHTADIAGIAKVCGRYGVPLLVDNAHGAYLHFLPEPCHPMDLGAYMCADSAHKTLSALTGAAYLHLSREAAKELGGEVKGAMAMTGTTSPSYLILQSLDLCNRYLAQDYRGRLARFIQKADTLKQRLTAEGIPLLESEALKVVVDAAAMGSTGAELGELLRAQRAEPEFTDEDYLVCMLTPENTDEDLARLERAMLSAPRRAARERRALRLSPLTKRMPIREAVFARHETVKLAQAAGRVCGQTTISCPPAIPIAVSGEEITREILPMFAAYGQSEISVVAEER